METEEEEEEEVMAVVPHLLVVRTSHPNRIPSLVFRTSNISILVDRSPSVSHSASLDVVEEADRAKTVEGQWFSERESEEEVKNTSRVGREGERQGRERRRGRRRLPAA